MEAGVARIGAVIDKKTDSARLFLKTMPPAYVLATALGACLVLASIWTSTLGQVEFDEGYNLQIPVSLVQTGVYRTTHESGQVFDPMISTGPAVLLPVAASFAVFGVGLYQARAIMFLFFVGTFLMLAVLAKRLYGSLAALWAVLLVASMPEIFQLGLKVLGEVPALLFFLLGVWITSRGRSLRSFLASGVFFGLAACTKIVFLLALLPAAVSLLVEWRNEKLGLRRRVLANWGALFVGFMLPNVLWEAFQLASLGSTAYLANKRTFLDLFRLASGVQVTSASSLLSSRIDLLNLPFQAFPLAWLLLILVLFHNGWIVYRQYQASEPVESARLFLMTFSLAFMAWWVATPNQGFWRHLLPGYAILMILVASSLDTVVKWAFSTLRSIKSTGLIEPVCFGKGVLSTACLATVSLLFAARAYSQVQQLPAASLLDDQRAIASRIALAAQNGGIIAYWGWYQSPEISFLSQVHFRDIQNYKTRNELDQWVDKGGKAFVLVSYVQRGMAPETWIQERKVSGQLVEEYKRYQLYEYVPDSQSEKQYQYVLQREPIESFSPALKFSRPYNQAQTGEGFYQDGWASQQANVWLSNSPGFRTLLMDGVFDSSFYGGQAVAIKIYVMDTLVYETLLSQNGQFRFEIPLPERFDKYRAVRIAIHSSKSFVPSDFGIPDRRELSVRFNTLALQ